MAYNPFNVFRRNQKGLFAVLTVFVMIMFVLSFGQGDFFQWLPTLFRGSKAKGEVVALANGDKIREGDIGDIINHRNQVGEFMDGSLIIAAEKLNQDLIGAVQDNRVSSGVKDNFRELLQSRAARIPYINPQFMPLLEQNPQIFGQIMQISIQNLQQTFSRIASSAPGDAQTQDIEMAQKALNLIDLDMARMQSRNTGYFRNRIADDYASNAAFEFKLWLMKADQLGIKITGKEAKELYFEEMKKAIEDVALAEMEKVKFNDRRDYSREKIFTYLADEFKVQFAQNAVLGGRFAPQGFESDWDRYDAFAKAVNGANYVLFSVPASNYLAKVEGEPTEAELRKLFDLYRSKEPDPAKDNLGLIEPRKIKVGWIAATGEEPYFVKAGEDSLKLGDLQARLFPVAMVPFAGTGMSPLTAPAYFNTKDPALQGAYRKMQSEQAGGLNLFDPKKFLDANAARRQGVGATPTMRVPDEAAIIGAMGGAVATRGSPFMLPSLVLAERVRSYDTELQAKLFAAGFTLPGAIGGNGLANAMAVLGTLPNPLPYETVKADLAESVRKAAIRDIAERDFSNFIAEVYQLGNFPSQGDPDSFFTPALRLARKNFGMTPETYVKAFADERALKYGQSKEFHDQYSIADDEALEPLVKMQRSGHSGMAIDNRFGQSFFFEFDPQTRGNVATKRLFFPQQFPERSNSLFRDGQTSYLAWRTADQAPQPPQGFQKSKDKTAAIWRLIEARKLAAKDAERWAEKFREGLDKLKDDEKTNSRITVDFGALHAEYLKKYPNSGKDPNVPSAYFFVNDVSPMSVSAADLRSSVVPQPQSFRLKSKPDMPKALPYPSGEMQAKLLDAREKPEGTVLTLADKSGDHCYVAMLQGRNFDQFGKRERFEKFYKYALEKPNTPMASALAQSLNAEANQARYQHALELLKAEFKVSEESEKIQVRKPKNDE